MEFHFNSWLTYFYFYCICGWIFESTNVSIRTKKLVNRGFMTGPWLPIYGSGAIVILLVTLPFQQHPVAVFFAGAIAATILEYVTGVMMVKIFKVRYWDYSYRKIQFQGHICLVSSITWGFLSLLMVYVIHEPVKKFIGSWNEEFLSVFTFLVTICMVFDFANAFREAMDLRALLLQAEELKKRLSEALEEQRENLTEAVTERREQLAQSVEERKEHLSQSVAERKEQLVQSVEEKKEQLEQSVVEKKEQVAQSLEEHKVLFSQSIADRKEQVVQSVEERKELLNQSLEEYRELRELTLSERQEKKEEAARERQRLLDEKVMELEAAREKLRDAMEKHSRRLLLHNPGAAYTGMDEESTEVKRRLLRKSKKQAPKGRR